MTNKEKRVLLPMEQLMPVLQLQLEQGGRAPLQVTGNSMYPMLRSHRDSVVLEPVNGALKKGDLIFYRRENGAYILHRIVKMGDGDAFVCSGDNQYEPEDVTAQQVIAQVTSFTRKGKTCSVTDKGYGRYVRIWVALFPVRRPILAVRRALGKAYSDCRKIIK